MKYFLIILLVYSFPLSAQNNYTLKASVPAAFEGTKLFLTIEDNYSLHNYKKIDSAVVKNNIVRFAGTLARPSEQAVLSNTIDTRAHRLHFALDAGVNILSVQPNPVFYNNKLSFISSATSSNQSNIILKQIDSLHERRRTT
ncbi:DUF4369 domain-containing protein [Chitinophaga sp. G-6-1-13]|uniref:DUF4369 domain-containing protein n=1 Tax=Chitinophaga fulva TaxID=2728842 RepID=A0A848GSA3_9BACT|nr:DUF4369 domain-containing protein [Chitinophaga fulva]NML39992.1 DUF4369 domain-containing protein [Chitinophaga fulva]